MAIGEDKSEVPDSDDNRWGPCTMPFWQTSGNGNGNGNGNGVASGGGSSSSQTSSRHVGVYGQYMMDETNSNQQQQHSTSSTGGTSVSSVAKSLLPAKKRLQLDPAKKLYFPYEPGKQVRSAIRLKNTSKSHAAFKFQTTAPKSCFMRPPGGILAPGESVIATVFKFVEPPEENENLLPDKCNVKFKIMSLKVKPPIEYVPELFDEQKDKVSVERILRVVFLDVENPSPQMEKLKNQLEEADAALEARRRPPEDTGPQIAGEGLVIDEWRERRERYLAQQQVEGVDSA